MECCLQLKVRFNVLHSEASLSKIGDETDLSAIC